MKILTFDIEEWFHLLECDDTETEQQWDKFEVRIYKNVERLLDILQQTDTKATFFFIGWIAKRYPDIVKKVAQHYEVGCHTMNHQLVWKQTPDQFKQDAEMGIKMLEDITGNKVRMFRAPGFSIRKSEAWAFETLYELGITHDSSVFPAHHAHGGMPEYNHYGPSVIDRNGARIKEFPIRPISILGKKIVYSGGGYFRLFPYWMIKAWATMQEDYVLSYIHPRDLDAGQPMIDSLSIVRKFKSYVGLKHAEKKLLRLLKDFRFYDIAAADQMINWDVVPEVNI
ncbi:MAG: polysaccharide deacetylase family protein [Muribaculaceae bacterium]|nr:polysaccharide deacetylase family protein [Muribaculaceae bacterium]